MAETPRRIADDTLTAAMTRAIWTGNYEKVLPISVQYFDLMAVLPAMFYMFRFGQRRGVGQFLDVYGNDGAGTKRVATVDGVAGKLAQTETLAGCDDEVKHAILGDLLLAFALENRSRALGRQEPIIRVAPAHYMASWVDLPQSVVHLRYVPEMLVALLADQDGERVELTPDGERTWFAVGRGFEDNLLLKVFHKGIYRDGPLADRTADEFDESADVGIDQLLMVRLAQQLGEAPDKLRGAADGGDKISNQRPIAERAARHFSEDMRHFIRAYAGAIPRHTFVDMLEACMAVGLTTLFTSVSELLFEWAEKGQLRPKCDQHPTGLFADCSNGVDRSLRNVAEQSMDDFTRRTERLPVVFMALRLLDYQAGTNRHFRTLDIPHRPYATQWITLLGDILHERHDNASAVLDRLDELGFQLAERLGEEYPDAAAILKNGSAQPNPVWRMAEALTLLQGRKNTQSNLNSMMDSCLLINRPNGLASKRAVMRQVGGAGRAGRKKRDVRSLVFTDSVLDHLVHLHLLHRGRSGGWRPLSYAEFLRAVRERYGFHVDTAPPGLPVSNELLNENRAILERRLRDLGLLTGVNDAESMKQLKPRFNPTNGGDA